jgi:O-antigen ligase
MRLSFLSLFAEVVGILSLFTMLLAFPLIRAELPIFWTTTAVRVLIGFFEILFVLGVYCSGKLRLPAFSSRSWIHHLALFWLLWSALSLVLADNPAAALVRQSEWYLHLLFAVALWSSLASEKALAGKIIKAILGGFLIYCLIFLYRWYAIYPEPQLHNWLTGMPGFSNIRHFGYYAMISVILSAFPLFVNRGNKGSRVLHFALMAGCWGALIWSGSRGSVFAVLFSLVLLAFIIPVAWRKRLLLYQAAAFTAGAYLSHFLGVNLRGFGLEYFWSSMKEPTISGFSSGRNEIWIDALPAVWAHPFLGVGADGFNFVPRTMHLWVSHPHNLLLQAAIDWGIPGLLFTCLLLLVVLRHFVVQLRQLEGISGEKIVSIWAFTALCMLAMIDGPFYHAHSMALTACLLAVALQIPPYLKQPELISPRPALMAFILAPLAAVLVVHLWLISAQLKEPAPEPESLVVKLARVLPTDISYSTRWAEAWADKYPEEAIQWLNWGNDYVRFNRKAAFMLAEAEIYMQQKRWPEAKVPLEKALSFFPHPKVEKRIMRHLLTIDQESPSSDR